MGRVEPVAVEPVRHVRVARGRDGTSVEQVTGLSGRVAGHVLDEAVAFALAWNKIFNISVSSGCYFHALMFG